MEDFDYKGYLIQYDHHNKTTMIVKKSWYSFTTQLLEREKVIAFIETIEELFEKW